MLRRHAGFLLEALDGPKQGPIGPFEHFQNRRFQRGA
jgi:hypothetical protein